MRTYPEHEVDPGVTQQPSAMRNSRVPGPEMRCVDASTLFFQNEIPGPIAVQGDEDFNELDL